MNKEMKKILSRYFFRCVIITCLLCFCTGIITAKQRSEYNSYFTPYAVMTLKSGSDTIDLSVDEKHYSVDVRALKDLAKYRSYLYFTPFSATVFFFESIYDFFSSFKD